MSEHPTALLEAYERVMENAHSQPISPPASLAVVGVMKGIHPIDMRNFVNALKKNALEVIDKNPDAAEAVIEGVVYSALLTGVDVVEDFAGIAGIARKRWWEDRRQGEMTPYYLGRVLDELGERDLARQAREGHFDDFAAPAEVADGMESVRLVAGLRRAMWRRVGQASLYLAVIDAVEDGEFDATKEESDRWAQSRDGQETFKRLTGEGEA